MEQMKIRAVIMRAGTSKGIFLRDVDLPKDKEERDKVILRILEVLISGKLTGWGEQTH